jgi:hypothetical protein
VSKINRARAREVRRLQSVLSIPYAKVDRSFEWFAIFRDEWTRFGWERLLPDYASALDRFVVRSHVLGRNEALPDFARDHLVWSADPGGGAPQRGAGSSAEAAFRYAMSRQGLAMPKTKGDLATTLAEIGLYDFQTTEQGEHCWRLGRMARTIDMLELPESWIEFEEEAWWRSTTSVPSYLLAQQFFKSRSFPRASTTIEALVLEGELDEDAVRKALDGLSFKSRLEVQCSGERIARQELARIAPDSCIEIVAVGDFWDGLPEVATVSEELISIEGVHWGQRSPWRTYIAVSRDERIPEEVRLTLSLLSFRLEPSGEKAWTTNLDRFASQTGHSVLSIAEAMSGLEEVGIISWSADDQVARLPSFELIHSVEGLR